MENIHLHSVIVSNKTLEILSADTDFYTYIGRDRVYNSFEKLIHEDARQRFLNIIQNKDTNPFVIDMVAENQKAIMVYMAISYNEDTMAIELEGVDQLKKGQLQYSSYTDLTRDLLGLHNDIVFTYDDVSKVFKLYTPDFRRCIRTSTYEEFVSEIKGNIQEHEYEKLDNMIISLKSTSGSFAYTFAGNIITTSEACKSSIVKGFTVERNEDFTAIGYIHRGSNKANASHTVEKDALTGVYSKREIANIVRKTIEVEQKPNIAICILDIDFFKNVNDNFGHMMGDVILKEIAEIIKFEVSNRGVVGRFGGDEFFVMFYDVEDMELCREKLRSIKNRVNTKYPKTQDEKALSVTLSIGCAVYPKDADNYDDLFVLADYCLYLAKDKGRNRYVIYDSQKHGTLEQIKDFFNNNRRIDNRKELAMGDVLCMIEDRHYNDEKYTPDMLVDDLVENLLFERIICLSGTPLKYRCMSGINLTSEEMINKTAVVFEACDTDKMFDEDVWAIDDIILLKNISEELYKAYCDMDIQSVILVRCTDAAGKKVLVSMEMTTYKIAWNRSQMYNYRKIARMFSKYEL